MVLPVQMSRVHFDKDTPASAKNFIEIDLTDDEDNEDMYEAERDVDDTRKGSEDVEMKINSQDEKEMASSFRLFKHFI